jgi:hypothetical protein
MTRHVCTVEMHLDHGTGAWWAGCNACRFSAAADTMAELKRLIRRGHSLRYRLDLVVDNAPPANTATATATTIVWVVR